MPNALDIPRMLRHERLMCIRFHEGDVKSLTVHDRSDAHINTTVYRKPDGLCPVANLLTFSVFYLACESILPNVEAHKDMKPMWYEATTATVNSSLKSAARICGISVKLGNIVINSLFRHSHNTSLKHVDATMLNASGVDIAKFSAKSDLHTVLQRAAAYCKEKLCSPHLRTLSPFLRTLSLSCTHRPLSCTHHDRVCTSR